MKALVSGTLLRSLALTVALLVTGCTTTVTDPVAVPEPDTGGSQRLRAGSAQPPDSGDPRNDLGQRSPDGGYWPLSRSNCVEGCLLEWLPVLVSEKIKFANLDPARLGSVARADGTRQVTVGGWPVYRFADDRVPGQVSGQGADGLWFVVAPDGSKAAAPAR